MRRAGLGDRLAVHNDDYDLFVIGAGSGGVRAARMAAGFGARVAIAEERYLGGTCVNVGCVPKKLFVYGAHFAEDFNDARAYGWDVGGADFHWPTLRDNKTHEIERLNGIYHGLLDRAGVDIFAERAVLAGPHRVRLGNRTVTAGNILVATGSWPTLPPFPGQTNTRFTSNEAFYLDEFPERVLIIGGGYIAVEFAGIYAGLGAHVTLAYRGELFLRGFDAGIRRFVAEEIRSKGVDLRFDTRIASVERRGGELRSRFEDGRNLDVDLVMAATGRAPASGDLGLEGGRREPERGWRHPRRSDLSHQRAAHLCDWRRHRPVAVDARGDRRGACALRTTCSTANLGRWTTATCPPPSFCQPNIGTVGPTEEEARRKHPNLVVYESSFKPMKHTLTGRAERTMMKLLVDGEDDRVLAAHMCGPEAGEIIQGLGVAIKAGATKADFDATIGIHPTAAEEFVTMREPARRPAGESVRSD